MTNQSNFISVCNTAHVSWCWGDSYEGDVRTYHAFPEFGKDNHFYRLCDNKRYYALNGFGVANNTPIFEKESIHFCRKCIGIQKVYEEEEKAKSQKQFEDQTAMNERRQLLLAQIVASLSEATTNDLQLLLDRIHERYKTNPNEMGTSLETRKRMFGS